jgi:hypothetical protein
LDPAGLPSTFDEWHANAGQEPGPTQPSLRVVIDPAQFSAWCRASSRQPDAAARMAFADIVGKAARRRTWWSRKPSSGRR